MENPLYTKTRQLVKPCKALEEYEQFVERKRLLTDLRSHVARGLALVQGLREETDGTLYLAGQTVVEQFAEAGSAFRVSYYAVRRGRWGVEDVLRKHLDQVVDNVPHGHNTGWPAMVIDERNVPVFAEAHLVEGMGEFVIHTQTVRIGRYERADP